MHIWHVQLMLQLRMLPDEGPCGFGPNYGIYSCLARRVREISATYGQSYMLMIVSYQSWAAHTYSARTSGATASYPVEALASWSRYVAQVCHAIIPSAMSASDTQCWWPITFGNDSIESKSSSAHIFSMHKQCYSFVSDLLRAKGILFVHFLINRDSTLVGIFWPFLFCVAIARAAVFSFHFSSEHAHSQQP